MMSSTFSRMGRFWFRDKTEGWIFLVALVLGLAFLVLLWRQSAGDLARTVLTGDAVSYFQLARQPSYFFSLDIRPLPETPDAFLRTPGYPLFLAPILRLAQDSILAVFVVQVIISALSAVLIYRIANLLQFPKLVGLGAGLLFALEPNIAVYAVSIITEPLFVFLLLLFTYLLVGGLLKNKLDKKRYLFLGMLSGFTVLVRPVLYPFIFVIIAVLAFYLIKQTRGRTWLKLTLIFTAGIYLLVFPWLLRNKIIFNTWSVSSISGVHAFLSYAVPFYAYQHGVNKNAAETELMKRIKLLTVGDKYDLRNSAIYKKFAREIITADLPGYLFFHAANTTAFFLGNGYRNIPRDLGFSSAYPAVNLSTVRLLINRQFGVLLGFFRSHPVYLAVFAGGAVLWFLITLFMLYGLLTGLFRESDRIKKYFLIFCGLAILYFAAVAGPEAYYKMRMPVNPFIFILAFYGLGRFLNKLSSNVSK